MRFEIHLGFEDYELLLHAFLISTQKVVSSEVLFQGVVVLVVLLLSPFIPSITDMASLVLISAMRVQFVIAVKSLDAESTLRMSLEATLVHSSGVVISKLFVLSQLLGE